jgi:hypothetical protein
LHFLSSFDVPHLFSPIFRLANISPKHIIKFLLIFARAIFGFPFVYIGNRVFFFHFKTWIKNVLLAFMFLKTTPRAHCTSLLTMPFLYTHSWEPKIHMLGSNLKNANISAFVQSSLY